MGFDELGQLAQPSVQLVGAQLRPFSHGRGPQIERTMCGQMSRQTPGPVGACEAGQRG